MRVSLSRLNFGREIFDTGNVPIGNHHAAKGLDVEPFVVGSFNGTVVEIKSVDVNVCFHCVGEQK